MKLVDFYREEIGNTNGHKWSEIMSWSDGAWEMDHDYIQFMFPSNEPSQLNGDAPTMTKEESDIFIADSTLTSKVGESFNRFLSFLGMRLEGDEVVSTTGELPEVLRHFNHNFLRITRCLKALRLTGNEVLANAFYKGLEKYKENVSANTWSHWSNAVSQPLWN